MKHSNWKGALQKPFWEDQNLQHAKKNKPLRRRVLIEEGLAKSSKKSPQRTQTSGIFVKQVVFLTVNHRGPLPLRELHSTGETIVWRDPGGSWACLPPVYVCVWNHHATGCKMWTTPEKHIKRRETVGNTNQNKTTRTAGYNVYEKNPKEAFRIKGALWNAAQNQNTNNNSWIEGQRKSPKTNQSNWKGALQKPLWEEQSLQNAKMNYQTTKKKSSDRRRPS